MSGGAQTNRQMHVDLARDGLICHSRLHSGRCCLQRQDQKLSPALQDQVSTACPRKAAISSKHPKRRTLGPGGASCSEHLLCPSPAATGSWVFFERLAEPVKSVGL